MSKEKSSDYINELKAIIFEKTGYVLDDADPIFPIAVCLGVISQAVSAEVLEIILRQKGSLEGEIAKVASDKIVRMVEHKIEFRISTVAAIAAFAIGIVVGGLAVALMMR